MWISKWFITLQLLVNVDKDIHSKASCSLDKKIETLETIRDNTSNTARFIGPWATSVIISDLDKKPIVIVVVFDVYAEDTVGYRTEG